MAVVLGSAITGGANTNYLTSPTYTFTEDAYAPNSRSKQWAVTALGGTQTGVDLHALSDPFQFGIELPANFRGVGVPNPVTGSLGRQPYNVFKLRLRKGVVPLSGQADQSMPMLLSIPVPAGADVADAPNIAAAISCFGGLLFYKGEQIADTVLTGIL